MRNVRILGALLAAAPSVLLAQSEAQLKERFEGMTVVVKLDMPATDDGVDLYPGRQPPIDFSRYAARIKSHGTALHAGDAVLVTKMRVQAKLIEFQLGGEATGPSGTTRAPM